MGTKKKGGSGGGKIEVTGRSKVSGDTAKVVLSDFIMKIIKSSMDKGNTLFVRLDDVTDPDGQQLDRLDRIAVFNQLSNLYHVEPVYLDDQGNITDEANATTTALAIRGDKNQPKLDIPQISCQSTSRTPPGVSKKGVDYFTPDPESKGNRYPGKKKKRKKWGESGGDGIIGTVERAMNEHYKRNNISKECKIEKIRFVDGEVDLDDLNMGQVTVDVYSVEETHTKDRAINFRRADELMAQQLNATKGKYKDSVTGEERDYTADDVKKWMEAQSGSGNDLRMTWHEKQDGKTMQKVPTILHGNIDHSGGISKESGKMNDIFDSTQNASAPVKNKGEKKQSIHKKTSKTKK